MSAPAALRWRHSPCTVGIRDAMPSADAILTGLTALANDWRELAIAWHVILAAAFAALVFGWRPSARLAAYLLVAPVLSVDLFAWHSDNPFNGTAFVLLAAALAAAANRFGTTPVRIASPGWIACAGAAIIYGYFYPHFLRTDSWTAYFYASPFGIVPCPTLSVVVGTTLLFQNVRSSSWAAGLVAAGLLYGSIGVFRLGVVLDWGLILASGALAVSAAVDLSRPHTVTVPAHAGERSW